MHACMLGQHTRFYVTRVRSRAAAPSASVGCCGAVARAVRASTKSKKLSVAGSKRPTLPSGWWCFMHNVMWRKI